MGAVNSCAAQHGGGYLLQAITNGDDLAFRRALSQQPSLAFWSNIVSRKTLVHAAAAVGRRDLVKMLIAAAHYHAARHCRSEADAQAAVRGLLDRGTMHGLTALMVACRRGHADVAAALLEAGADPLLADRHEHTCLHYAALFGWANCIAALLEGAVRLGGDAAPLTWLKDVRVDAAGLVRYVDARAAPGLTPLHLAAMHGRAAAASALLAAGADMTARVGGGAPTLRGEHAARWPPAPADAAPVHLAAAANSLPVVRLLMEAWARRELAVRADAAGAAGSGRAAGGSEGDPRVMRTWSGLRPVDVALTYGAAPGVVRMLEVDLPPEALLPHYCDTRVPKLAHLAAAAHRGLLLRHLARLEPRTACAGAACEAADEHSDAGLCPGDGPPAASDAAVSIAAIHAPAALAVEPACARGAPADGGTQDTPACSKGAPRKRLCLRSLSVDFEVHCFLAGAGGARTDGASPDAGLGSGSARTPAALPERTPSVLRRAASVTTAMLAAAADQLGPGPDAEPDAALGGIAPAEPSGGGGAAPGKAAELVLAHGALIRAAKAGRRGSGPLPAAAVCECPICFEVCAQVAAACGHTLCGGCAGQLCAGGAAHLVPACPFCRLPIAGFEVALAAC